MTTPSIASDERCASMPFRRCGRSGLDLPAVSLGLWQNFGGVDVFETGRAVVRRAFDRGVTHLDLANNYGPPHGSAEANFGRMLANDLRPYRDELVIATKAGFDMWPGPYGDGGSRKYLVASLDQSLRRMGLDYVDIYYHHRPDPRTPVEETMAALDHLVRRGKALYVGLSNYPVAETRRAATILAGLGTPCLIHQPSYSMLNRWIEPELLAFLDGAGIGCIAYSPLAQGMLTSKYLGGVPADSRAARGGSTLGERLTESVLQRLRALDALARRRGQSLAQLALAWVLRDPRITSALIGARDVKQLDDNLDALAAPALSTEELAEVERHLAPPGA